MSPGTISPLAGVKAITCDVFGTVVDWRPSVTEELTLRAHRKQSGDLPAELKSRLEGLFEEDWARFAQEWRDSYMAFCVGFDAERDAWKSVDEHHRDSLVSLLKSWSLEGLYSAAEVESLSLVWHRLSPWPDSADGLAQIGKRLVTATLSNGNLSLLRDLNDFGSLGFQKIFSAETFHTYKPDPATYLGAARMLNLEPGQIAMVAAHLGDLQVANSLGLKTVYIERPGEEDWGEEEERHKTARDWVDLWIPADGDGFKELDRKLSELEWTS